MVAFLHKHVEQLGPLADASLAQLGLADKAVVCVPGEMSAIHAFASMAVSAAHWPGYSRIAALILYTATCSSSTRRCNCTCFK